MSDVVTGQLAAAVELRCGGKAFLVDSSEVRLHGGLAWVGRVYVFDVQDHDHSRRAYAWPTAISGGIATGIHVVLQLPSIMSPADAVTRVLGGRRRTAATGSGASSRDRVAGSNP